MCPAFLMAEECTEAALARVFPPGDVALAAVADAAAQRR